MSVTLPNLELVGAVSRGQAPPVAWCSASRIIFPSMQSRLSTAAPVSSRPAVPLAVLDVNIWLDYFRDDEPAELEAQRARLRLATSRGLVRPMLTTSLSAELAGTCEHMPCAAFSEMMLFAWEVCEERVLANVHDRSEREIFWERKLTLEQALVPLRARRHYREHQMLDRKWSREIAATVAAAMNDDHTDEHDKKRGTIEELDARDVEQAREAAAANDGRIITPWRDAILADEAARDALILDWALDEMVTVAMHTGLPFARDRLPDPRALPSFYLAKVVHVRRIHGALLEERGGRELRTRRLHGCHRTAGRLASRPSRPGRPRRARSSRVARRARSPRATS